MLSFELQPTLKGKLIQLRPLLESDFEELYKAAQDPKTWEQHPEKNRFERPLFEKYFRGAIESRGAFAVVDLATQTLIGSSRFYDFDESKRQIKIGYTFLNHRYWGGRYNREMKSKMLSHAFRYVDLVFFEVGTQNLRSRKAMERIGAKFVGESTTTQTPHVVYKIERSDFELSHHG